MLDVPKGWNVLVECDIPFPLPTINDYSSKIHPVHRRIYHERQRRDIYEKFENSLHA